MSKGAYFCARFNVQLYEDERLVLDLWSPNRILRVGLLAVVRLGISPSQFSTFAVGTGVGDVSAAYTNLVSPLSDGELLGVKVAADFPQWSYTATYAPGKGTGIWTEIGMRYGGAGPLLNRAIFINSSNVAIPVNKTDTSNAIVTVLFTMSRE